MITSDQIKQASDTDLPRLAGEVLSNFFTIDDICEYCSNRQPDIDIEFQACAGCLKLSKHEDFITLTPGNAFKWRDWCKDQRFGKELLLRAAMELYSHKIGGECSVVRENDKVNMLSWLAFYATPVDWLKIACLFKLGMESQE